MKAQEVLKTLRISRPTLCKYVKEGKIKYKELPSGETSWERFKGKVESFEFRAYFTVNPPPYASQKIVSENQKHKRRYHLCQNLS